MSTMSECEQHQVVTQAVHDNGGKIAMQILHTGRYAYHPFPVSASALKSPIGMSVFFIFVDFVVSVLFLTQHFSEFKCTLSVLTL